MKKTLLFVVLVSFLATFAQAGTRPKAPEPEEDEDEAPIHKKVTLSDLTTDEVKVYQYGEISTGSLIGGGLLGTIVGLGTGHIVYGQYGSKGWIFTVGEIGSLALMAYGTTRFASCFFTSANDCVNSIGIMAVGEIGYLGLRVFEIVDVWTAPGAHNRQYRAIKARLEGKEQASSVRLVPLVASDSRVGTQLGVVLGFQF